MNFDSDYYGPQGVTSEDSQFAGSRFAEVREALYQNRYYLTWGAAGETPLPVYETSLGRMLSGILPFGRPWRFLEAARRTVESEADLRWGPDRRGFRRLIHPNGVCLLGTWEIDESAAGTSYSGCFKPGSKSLIIARYSSGLGVLRGDYRTLSLVGKIYPTTDPNHRGPLRTANFFTQEELGGAKTDYINDAELRNAPDTTPWRRRLVDVPKLLTLGLALSLADSKLTIRQVYPIAELGKPDDEPTKSPEFMRLLAAPDQPRILGDELDFRDEVLAQVYDQGDPEPKRTLTFNIEVSDEGKTTGIFAQRRIIKNWKRIGRIVFTEAVASYNGDFVLHFPHPTWRKDRNKPTPKQLQQEHRRLEQPAKQPAELVPLPVPSEEQLADLRPQDEQLRERIEQPQRPHDTTTVTPTLPITGPSTEPPSEPAPEAAVTVPSVTTGPAVPPRPESQELSAANWQAWSFAAGWTVCDVGELEVRDEGDFLLAANKTGRHEYGIIAYTPTVLDGDFTIVGEARGPFRLLGIIKGSDDGAAMYWPWPPDTQWRPFVIQRSGTTVTATLDGNPWPVEYYATDATVSGNFHLGVYQNQECAVRRLSITIGKLPELPTGDIIAATTVVPPATLGLAKPPEPSGPTIESAPDVSVTATPTPIPPETPSPVVPPEPSAPVTEPAPDVMATATTEPVPPETPSPVVPPETSEPTIEPAPDGTVHGAATTVDPVLPLQGPRDGEVKEGTAPTPTPAGASSLLDCHQRTIRLKSWKGDYLHRPDSAQGVTTWHTGIGNEWTVEVIEGGQVKLKSWKGDYLHRPDSAPDVTTWHTGIGNEWTVEPVEGGKLMLKSWKGDYLHRPDSAQGVTTWGTGIGNQWNLEVVEPESESTGPAGAGDAVAATTATIPPLTPGPAVATPVLLFNGQGDRVELPYALPSSIEDAVTVEFWAKGGDDLPKATTVFEAAHAAGERVLNIHLPWSDGVVYWDAGNATAWDRIEKPAPPEEYRGVWTHWAFAKDVVAGTMWICRNGTLWHEGASKTARMTGAVKSSIGSWSDAYYPWSGRLAEFHIWQQGRTPEQIQAGMHQRLTGNEPGLVGCWPLAEVDADGKTPDLGPHKNHGTVHGANITSDPSLQLGSPAPELSVVGAISEQTGQAVSSADTTSYVVPAGTAGNQEYAGSLGMDFDVNQAIAVTALGVFDDLSDGLQRTITAHVYDRTNPQQPLVTLQFDAADPGQLDGGSRFKPLATPLELPAGFQGTIVAEGYGSGERNGNNHLNPVWSTDDGGGLLSFVGSSRYGAAGTFPTTIDAAPNQYAAGTFKFQKGVPVEAANIAVVQPETITGTVALPQPDLPTKGEGDQIAAKVMTSHVVPAGTAGNQEYAGSLGMDFDVQQAIAVTALGVFDDLSDGLQRTITAHVYDRTNPQQPLVTLQFDAADPGQLDGGSRFKPLATRLELPAGFQGTIVAEGYGSGERNGNNHLNPVWSTDDGGGLLSFVGSSRYGAAGTFPTTLDAAPNQYAAGTFKFHKGNVVLDRPSPMFVDQSKIKLKSWKGDYLHRPDSAQGVTTWHTGIGNDWTVELIEGGKVRLRSWKGDYLHRPDSAPDVTTWHKGNGNEWTVEAIAGGKLMLKSWKGDYLHRPDSAQGVTTWNTGIGNEWSVEAVEATTSDTAPAKALEVASWSPWASLESRLTSAPVPVSWSGQREYVFVRGADYALWYRYYDGQWHDWQNLGGVLGSDPAVASWGEGRWDVFARGTDNTLLHICYDNGQWSDWANLAGALISEPEVVSRGTGSLHVFGRGTDSALWLREYVNGTWTDWQKLDGQPAENPFAIIEGGRLHVFIRGLDSRLWHRMLDQQWHDWEDLEGSLNTSPFAASLHAGHLDVYVRGTGMDLAHRCWDGQWQAWESLGGSLSTGPVAVSEGGRLHVFAGAMNFTLLYIWQEAGTWHAWENLGGGLSSVPAAVSRGSGHVDVFVRGGDHALWYLGSGQVAPNPPLSPSAPPAESPEKSTPEQSASSATIQSGTQDEVTIVTGGVWESVTEDLIGGANLHGVGTQQINWGTPLSGQAAQSGYRFDGATASSVSLRGAQFDLGTFTHDNYRITGHFIRSAVLSLTMQINHFSAAFNFQFGHNETPNEGVNGVCPWTPAFGPPCPDVVTILNLQSHESVKIGDKSYALCVAFLINDQYATQLVSLEDQKNTVRMRGYFVELV